MRGSGILAVAIVAGMVGMPGRRATAHTLPISYVFVVADKNYVHLEFSFNPFELTSFTELDTNKNARLDPEELTAAQEKVSRQILDHLVLSANGKPVAAETAGISPDGDSHHAVLRAHYRVDASKVALTLESTLQEITSSSHLSQVNFLRDGKPQLAQLDAQSHKVAFPAPARVVSDPASPMGGSDCSPANRRNTLVALGAAFALVFFAAVRQATRNTPAPRPENSLLRNQPPKP